MAALEPALRGVHTLAEAGELVAAVVRTPERRVVARAGQRPRALPRAADRAEARELVDELRRAGVPLKEARLSLTGRERGPELWAVLAALPRDEAIRRAA